LQHHTSLRLGIIQNMVNHQKVNQLVILQDQLLHQQIYE